MCIFVPEVIIGWDNFAKLCTNKKGEIFMPQVYNTL